MLDPREFYRSLVNNGFAFFTGVPDSLLKSFCAVLEEAGNKSNHVITANEGNALSVAAGYYLATSNPAVVYLQNSGLGNIVNPLLSLTDSMVYKIPALLIIGWRGEPGIKDEPQHERQGMVTLELLRVLGIEYTIIDENFNNENMEMVLPSIAKKMRENLTPYAIVVRKNTFEPLSIARSSKNDNLFTRERAVEIIISHIEEKAVVVSTTGKTSRELFEIREKHNLGHGQDFLTVGSMGHCSQIALGISMVHRSLPVYCIDGEGSLLMHMGSLAVNGDYAGDYFTHIVINNGVHESVGGQPNSAQQMNIGRVASATGYKFSYSVEGEEELVQALEEVKKHRGSCMLEIRVKPGSRKDLGRPTISPQTNKEELMKYLSQIN